MGLRSRLRLFIVRALRAGLDQLEEAPSSGSQTPVHDLETLRRIYEEYVVSLNKFVAQRDEWKAMFFEWRQHLTAQRMLVRALETGRAEVLALTRLHAARLDGLSDPRTVEVKLLPFCQAGAGPADCPATYEKYMEEFSRDPPSLDPLQEQERIASILKREKRHATSPSSLDEHEMSESDALTHANAELFRVIQRMEEVRNIWKERYLHQQRLHGTAQAALQVAIGRVSEVHAALLRSENEARVKKGLPPILTRDDLKDLLAEAGKPA